jgi:tetratricopeptide (TPR) repeat protein
VKRAGRLLAVLTVLPMWAAGAASWAASTDSAPERCQTLLKHGRRNEAKSCFQALVRQDTPYLRAEGYWGLGEYSEANQEFRAAVMQADGNARYRVRWGLMLHERFNNQDAQALLKEALARDPKNAQAFLGLALVSADGFDSGATEWARKALQVDPQLAPAHELLGSLALEDSEPEQAAAEADAALQISADSLDAMAARRTRGLPGSVRSIRPTARVMHWRHTS